MRQFPVLLTSCLVGVIFAVGVLCTEALARDKKSKKKKGSKDPAAQREAMANKVRQALGDVEDGHFVVVLKKTYYEPVKWVKQPNGNSFSQVRAPRGRPFAIASYEVWTKKGREPAVELVMEHLLKFLPDISGKPPVQQPAAGMPMSTTDFRVIGRYDDETTAIGVQRDAKKMFDRKAKATR